MPVISSNRSKYQEGSLNIWVYSSEEKSGEKILMWKILAYMVLKVLKLGEITLGKNIKRNVGWEIKSREEQVKAI